jgi:hypothetical protein
MSPLVKTKRQANFKDFKRFAAFKGLVEQKNVVFNSFVCQLGFFGTCGPLKRSFHSRFKLARSCQKSPIYTRTTITLGPQHRHRCAFSYETRFIVK